MAEHDECAQSCSPMHACRLSQQRASRPVAFDVSEECKGHLRAKAGTRQACIRRRRHDSEQGTRARVYGSAEVLKRVERVCVCG
eukprot:3199122-Pleurochrysis_carterae.AAC.1